MSPEGWQEVKKSALENNSRKKKSKADRTYLRLLQPCQTALKSDLFGTVGSKSC